MSSTMKKLKMKMERWIDENDDEDAQELVSLVPGSFTFTTAPNLTFFCYLPYLLKQEDQEPPLLILEVKG